MGLKFKITTAVILNIVVNNKNFLIDKIIGSTRRINNKLKKKQISLRLKKLMVSL